MQHADNTKKAVRQLGVLIGLLILLFSATMISVFSVKIPYRDVLRMAITTFGFLMLLAQLYTNVFARKNVLLALSALALLIAGTTFVSWLIVPETKTTFAFGILTVFDSVMWIGVFSWAYYLGSCGKGVVEQTEKTAWAIILFSVLFLGVKSYSAGKGIPLINTSYYALFLLPFALMMKNRAAKWGLTFCAVFVVMLSGKRGGFLAFIFAMVVYFLVAYNQTEKNPKRLRMVLGALLLVVLLNAFLREYVKTHDVLIFERILSMEEDQGSGRLEIWKETWKMICESDFLSLLLGHGYNAVDRDSALGARAHTDVLEAIYDYGIVGTVLYSSFVVKVFGAYKKVKVAKPHLAAPYAVSLTLFACLSLVAHLLTEVTHFMFLCVFWGATMGELDQGVTIRRRI